MELYLIRHAQSQNNLSYEENGTDWNRVEDPELTDLGRQQAKRLADFLGGWRSGPFFTHLYSSLMVRAVATAATIGPGLQIRPIAWPEVHECMGIYLENEKTGVNEGKPGKDRSYFEQHYPELLLPDSLDHEGWWNRPVENPPEWRSRARNFVHELKRRHGGSEDRVAVITHGGFYHEILCVLFDTASTDGIWFTMHNTAISKIGFLDRYIRVDYLNRADHLPPDLLS